MLDTAPLQEYFTGEIIKPGDEAYDAAAHTFTHTGSPAIILQPRIPSDVSHAIRFAISAELPISVRSGGHSNAGLSTNDGGIVIDLCHFANVEVLDAEKRIVRIGSGALWGDVARKLQEHGLGLTAGDTSTVGVGGLTQGGGIGWMARQYGLTIDHLVAAQIVDDNGTIIRATADDPEYADLFWAIRGGAGNMGIVTHFEFIAHPVSTVHFGALTFKLDNLKVLLTGWRNYMRIAPEELTTSFIVMPGFGGGEPSAIIACCYNGADEQAASEALAPLRSLDTPVSDAIESKPYADVLEEAHPPKGMRVIVRNTFMRDFSDEAIDIIAAHPEKIYMIRSLGGAMNRIAADDTAFAHRDSEVMVVVPTFIEPGATEVEIAAALEVWNQLKALGEGSYIGFSSDATEEEVRRAFPPATYARLAAIKQEYDPQNIFNQNYNIKPGR